MLEQVTYKLRITAHSYLHGPVPQYLVDLCLPVYKRRFSAPSQICQSTTPGPSATPRAWNALPDNLRDLNVPYEWYPYFLDWGYRIPTFQKVKDLLLSAVSRSDPRPPSQMGGTHPPHSPSMLYLYPRVPCSPSEFVPSTF